MSSTGNADGPPQSRLRLVDAATDFLVRLSKVNAAINTGMSERLSVARSRLDAAFVPLGEGESRCVEAGA